MKKSLVVFCVMVSLVIFSTSSAIAHCIWAEAPAMVSLNKEITFNAYFAHADDPLEERELTSMGLVVFEPGGEIRQIDLDERATYYEAAVRLTKPGQHVFVLERDPNRYRLTEIRDFSKSVTWAGEAGSIVHDPVGIPLEVHPVEVTELDNGMEKVTVAVLYNGEPVSGGEIEVFKSQGPDTILYDEIAEYDVPENGKVTLTIDPAYKYVLETDHRVPAREVSGTGLAITEVRFRSTLFLGAM